MVPIEKEALGASSRRVVEIVEPPGGAGRHLKCVRRMMPVSTIQAHVHLHADL